MILKITEEKSFQEYRYLIEGTGVDEPENAGSVTIVFQDGKFKKCDYPFRGPYTRAQWNILAQIADQIRALELENA